MGKASVFDMQKYSYSYMKLGEAIMKARKRANLSQRKLAAMCGLHYNTICSLEKGKGNASIETLFKISDALEIELYVRGKDSPDDESEQNAVRS